MCLNLRNHRRVELLDLSTVPSPVTRKWPITAEVLGISKAPETMSVGEGDSPICICNSCQVLCVSWDCLRLI